MNRNFSYKQVHKLASCLLLLSSCLQGCNNNRLIGFGMKNNSDEETKENPSNDNSKKNSKVPGHAKVGIECEELVKPLVVDLKVQKNPFLFSEAKEFLLAVSPSNFKSVKTPPYFPEKLKLSINGFLKNLDAKVVDKIIPSLHKQVAALPVPENTFWEEASVLLNTSVIKSLPVNDFNNLASMIADKGVQNLESFLHDENIGIDCAKLESEVTNSKIRGKKIPNLTTLTAQIIKSKPKEASLYRRLLDNKQQLNVFKDQCIYINSPDYSYSINGKISDAYANGSHIIFEVKRQDVFHKITLDLNADYIYSVTVVSESLKPLIEELKPRHKYSGVEGEVILKDVQIQVCEKHVNEKTAVLPNGVYDIVMGKRFNLATGHYLYFENKLKKNKAKENKKVCFSIYDGGCDKNTKVIEFDRVVAKINHEEWQSESCYADFFKWYKILVSEEKTIEFKDSIQSEALLSIKKVNDSDATDMVEKMDVINNSKTQLIHKLQSSYKDVFKEILNDLMILDSVDNRGKFILNLLSNENNDAILNDVDTIIQLYKEIGFNQTRNSVIEDVVVEANFSSLVSKEGTVDIVRILNLLADSQHYSNKMQGKDIIAFFGSTGSGKSTSVNYLMGVPLEKYVNSFGDQVVRLKKGYKNDNSANIGQSICTSETVYSRGHDFITDNLGEDVAPKCENKMLCDNPGFHDTRGSIYEICTNLSIDQSICKAGGLKAVVLVVPYHTFTLDRANHLLSLVSLMNERFNNVLERNSVTNKAFHILITKWQNELQKNGFRDRLMTYVAEENNRIAELFKTNPNDIGVNISKERLSLFNLFLYMYNDGRIKFADVTDGFERDDLILSYLNSKVVPKENYKKAMEGEDMREAFAKQISLSAHTWTKQILQPYLFEMPEELSVANDRISDCMRSIEYNGVYISNKEIAIKDTKAKIISIETELENLAKGIVLKAGKKKIDSIEISDADVIKIESYVKEIKSIDDSVADFEDKSYKVIKELEEISEELNVLEKDLALLNANILEHNTGETVKEILNVSYINGNIEKYGYWKKGERENLLRDVSTISNDFVLDKEFKAGYEVITLKNSYYISKKYAIVPENTNFDKAGTLRDYTEGAIYKALVKTNKVTLTGANAKPTGIEFVIQCDVSFDISPDLPYLLITHTIPNSKIFADAIVNDMAYKGKTEARIRVQKLEIERLNDKLAKLEADKENLRGERQLKQHTIDDIKKAINIESKKKQLLKEKENSINSIDLYIKDIKDKEQRVISLKQETTELEAKLVGLKYKYKRFAFLIRDQLDKKIPQSLFEFISIAFDLNKKQVNAGKNDNFTKAAQIQNNNFIEFKDVYSQYGNNLYDIVCKHLSE